MLAEVQNLTNGPLDLEGGHILPVGGSVTADFSASYLDLLDAAGAVRVTRMADNPAPVATRPKRGRPPKNRT